MITYFNAFKLETGRDTDHRLYLNSNSSKRGVVSIAAGIYLEGQTPETLEIGGSCPSELRKKDAYWWKNWRWVAEKFERLRETPNFEACCCGGDNIFDGGGANRTAAELL